MKAFRIEETHSGCGVFASPVYSMICGDDEYSDLYLSILNRHNKDMPNPFVDDEHATIMYSFLDPKFAFPSMEELLYFLNDGGELPGLLKDFPTLRIFEFEVSDESGALMDETQLVFESDEIEIREDITEKVLNLCSQSKNLHVCNQYGY